MADATDYAAIWAGLRPLARLVLLASAHTWDYETARIESNPKHVRGAYFAHAHEKLAARELERAGLVAVAVERVGADCWPTAKGRALAEWARAQGEVGRG